MKSKLFKFTVFTMFILLISVGIAFAEDNSTDNQMLGEGEFNDFSQIQTGIDNAEEGGVVELNGTYQASDNRISITKTLTLNGNNDTILDGDFHSYFEATSTVTFKNITFNRMGNSDHAAVNVKGNSIFINCRFIGCMGSDGSAVNSNGNAQFINCSFNENSAWNGGVLYLKGTSTITDCTFTSNKGWGEGIIDNQGDLTVSGSSFISNFAEGHVGVIYSHHGDEETALQYPDAAKSYANGNVKIYSSRFENNAAAENVGVIFSSHNLIIDSSNFTSNRAKNIGVIYSSANLQISNSRFIKNSVYDSHNRGFIEGGLVSTILSIFGKTTIQNSEFRENLANFAGLSLSKTSLEMSGNVFASNTLGTVFVGDCTSKYPKYTVLDDNLKPIKVFKLTVDTVTTTADKEKLVTVKLVNPATGKPIVGAEIDASYKSRKSTTHWAGVTNSKGIAKIHAPTTIAGTHKFNVCIDGYYLWANFASVTAKYIVKKIPTKIKAPKVTFRHKQKKFFKVTVKTGKKAVKGVWVKIKIGKKVYKAKTNSKGVAKVSTKRLKVGKHNVVISSGDGDYGMKAKSTIRIKR